MAIGKKRHTKIQNELNGNAPENEKADNRKLIELKYEALFYRYYFYARIHKYDFEKITNLLSQQFFLGGSRISDLLGIYAPKIKEVCNKKMTVKQLSEKYPLYTWPEPKPEKKERVVFN